MSEGEEDQTQEALDFEGRREWLGKPAVRKLLVSLALRKLGQTREAAEELVQDFYSLKLNPVARAYEPTRLDPALVVTAFLNFGRSKLGRQPGPPLVSIDDPDHDLVVQQALKAAAPATGLGRGCGDPELLSRALERLPASTRALIDGFYMQELSYAELAERQGKTVPAIKVALHRARHLLRREYQDEAIALTVSDIPGFSTFVKTFGASFSMPNTPVGFIFSLLPPAVQASLVNGASHDSANGNESVALVRALNDVVRLGRLDDCPCLTPILASLDDTRDPSELTSVSLRNRQILEVVFQPLIRRFDYASVL